MKKNYKLTKQELSIRTSIETGKARSVSNLAEEKAFAKKMAQANIAKRTPINIRVMSADISKLKAKAEEEGIPYQTLITSVLHKYATGKLK